ncbi:MAG: archease [Candidatus Lokiarchaeota archaeon]|nr:archease [Candidatus Lokiarchaeota archaeon]
MKNAGFEFKEHTADIRVKSWGRSLEEAFSQTAYSLMTTLSPDLKKISPIVKKKIKIIAEDIGALLFDFLSEFLYIFDVQGLIFSKIDVLSITKSNNKYKLVAQLQGENFNSEKHDIGTEVKAITYSFMNIEQSEDRVTIDIVFDI